MCSFTGLHHFSAKPAWNCVPMRFWQVVPFVVGTQRHLFWIWSTSGHLLQLGGISSTSFSRFSLSIFICSIGLSVVRVSAKSPGRLTSLLRTSTEGGYPVWSLRLFLIEKNMGGILESHVLWLPSVSNACRPFYFLIAPFDGVGPRVIYQSCPVLGSPPLDRIAHVVCTELGSVVA